MPNVTREEEDTLRIDFSEISDSLRALSPPAIGATETLNTWSSVVSPHGTYRVHPTSAGKNLVLNQMGNYRGPLPSGSWSKINNRAEAYALATKYVPAANGLPTYYAPQLRRAWPYSSDVEIISIPHQPGISPAYTLCDVSDDGTVLLSRTVKNGQLANTTVYELFDIATGTLRPVRRPGLSGEGVPLLSRQNTRLLGSGSRPYCVTPDGTSIQLTALRIKNNPTDPAVPFGTLYPKTLTPNHIASDGRITLTTTNAQNQTTILQIVPHNDADGDGLMDDWEKSFAHSLLEIDNDPESWGAQFADLLSGDLNPDADYTNEGITASELAQYENSTPSLDTEQKIHWQFQGKRNILDWGLYKPAENGRPERIDGLYLPSNDGYFGTSRSITLKEELKPEYLVTTVQENQWQNGLNAGSGSSYFFHLTRNSATEYYGETRPARGRFVRTMPSATPYTASFLKVTIRRDWNEHTWETVKAEGVKLTIPAGKDLTSAWVELIPPVADGWEYMEYLLPVEVEQEGYTSEKGIRFCRWLDSFTENTLDADCADKDRDRFRIRIPAVLPNLSKIHIRSFGLASAVINGGWEFKSTDGDYDVTMTEENGAMVSKWMLLVSDGDDDLTYNGIGWDNETNDQTLLADFNSPIEVTLPELQNAKVTFHAQKPLGDVEIQPYYLSPAGDVPSSMENIIKNHLEKMKEIYRQIGVRVGYYGIVGKAVPQSWFNSNADTDEPPSHFTKSETLDAEVAVAQTEVPEKQIRVAFVDATLMVGWGKGSPVLGFASDLGEDPVIVSLDRDRSDARWFLALTAHEVGHVLGLDHLEQVEPAQYNPIPRQWLMRNAGDGLSRWNNEPTDTKRFQSGDLDIIRNSNFFDAPN